MARPSERLGKNAPDEALQGAHRVGAAAGGDQRRVARACDEAASVTVHGVQEPLFEEPSPAAEWDRDVARHALDELFSLARLYRSSEAYWKLLQFIGRFRFYAPFNAMLVHIQKPGATYVAPPHRWLRDYRRRIQPGANPLVILQPMGPVMFVFDVADTEPEEGAPPLPREIEAPFEVRGGRVGRELVLTIENARRDGVEVTRQEAGSQSAGMIQATRRTESLSVVVREKPEPQYLRVPLRYEVLLNSKHSAEASYATLVHELAHLYCGHLGTPDPRWWPDRRGLAQEVCEFEAESVCSLICTRLGIDNPSEEYLAAYFGNHEETPPISFDRVMAAAGLIEQMGRERLKPRKEKE